MNIWFILIDGAVQGPFNKEQIELMIKEAKNPLVWGKGLSEWLSPTKWREHLATPQGKTLEAPAKAEVLWSYQIKKKNFGPFDYQQLLKELRNLASHDEVLVQSTEQSVWIPLYSLDSMLSDLGISRREHPRVPILALLDCKAKDASFKLRMHSLSEGGAGVTSDHVLQIGENFDFTMNSPNLVMPIYGKAEVVFSGGTKEYGLKFVGLSADAQSLIADYVRKFRV